MAVVRTSLHIKYIVIVTVVLAVVRTSLHIKYIVIIAVVLVVVRTSLQPRSGPASLGGAASIARRDVPHPRLQAEAARLHLRHGPRHGRGPHARQASEHQGAPEGTAHGKGLDQRFCSK